MLLGLYIGVLVAVVIALAALLAFERIPVVLPAFSGWEFAFLLMLALLAEKATIAVGHGFEISASLIAYFISVAVLGPLPGMAIAVIGQTVHFQRRQWSRNLCFAAAAGIETGLAGIIYWAVPAAFGASANVLVIGGVVAGIAFQLVNYVLLAPVAYLRRGHGLGFFWREGFQPFLPYHLFFLAMSLGLVWIFNRSQSPVAFFLLLLPVVGLIFSFRAFNTLRVQSAENRRLAVRNERLALQAIAALLNTVDAKDNYTARHSAAVAQWATAIAEHRGLTTAEVELTHLASLMHDVGKIAIPDRVLKGTGPLSPADRELMNTHSQVSHDILADIDDFRDVAWVALHHHERYDGTGYPSGMVGESIPLLSRIVAVADSYSAMMMERPYRPRLRVEDAKKELLKNRGTQFDPQVVDEFLTLLDEHDHAYQMGDQADFRLEVQKAKFLRGLCEEE